MKIAVGKSPHRTLVEQAVYMVIRNALGIISREEITELISLGHINGEDVAPFLKECTRWGQMILTLHVVANSGGSATP